MPTNDLAGYILLNAPTDQVQPLGILSFEKKGTANTTGMNIKDFFVKSTQGKPIVSKDYDLSSDINKSLELELSVDGNLSFLQGLLKFLNIGASFQLEKNRKVKVKLIDPKKDIVNEFKLDAYINNAIKNNISPTFSEMLDQSELYVIIDILKCKKYSLNHSDEKFSNTTGNAEAPGMGETGVKVSTKKSDKEGSFNEGKKYITVAVKALRIYCVTDETGKTSYRLRKDEKLKEVKKTEDFPGEFLSANSIMVANDLTP